MKKIFLFSIVLVTVSCFTLNAQPVTFANISVTPQGDDLEISWSTLNETNNDYFEVERSTDSVNYTSIANISGIGNSSVTNNYSYVDNTVLPGEDYCYRIRQVDLDGNSNYSSEVCYQMIMGTYEFSLSSDDIFSFPNPVEKIWNLVFTNNVFENLIIYDFTGKKIMTVSVLGKDRIEADLTSFAPGVYFYFLYGSEGSNTGKLMKK